MDTALLGRAFNKAKIDLISDSNAVFISTIILSLKHSWNDEIPTLRVNAKELQINAQFFLDELTIATRKSALAHEAWHIAFRHLPRANNVSDFNKYNRAADYVINIMLKDIGYEIPSSWLCDSQYRDMSTEQVYNLLPDEPPKPNPQADDFEQIKSDEDIKTINNTILRANTIAQLSGNKASKGLPGEVQIYIDNLLKPKLNPAAIFRNLLNGMDTQDYSLSRPNRRFMPDFYLPSLYSESIGEIAVAVDSSGSVSDRDFLACASEIDNFIRKVKPSKTTIVTFDTDIRDVKTLSAGQSLNGMTFKGRGGTDLQPVFDHFDKKKPHILIIFSDLWCDEIRIKPDYPVVWVCCNNPKARVHFGTKIDYQT